MNGYGNNIYLDNVRIITNQYTDIAMNALLNPSPVIGVNEHDLAFEVINLGSKTIKSINYDITQNKGVKQNFIVNNITILPGQRHAIEHGPLHIQNKIHQLRL